MLQFVQQKKWQQTDPIPSWKSPDSIQMTLVAHFFKLSQVLRTIHTTLMETYGLPTWGSYLIFAIGTIIMGAFLGLVLVCIIDLLYPPRKAGAARREETRARGDHGRKSDDEQELINDDIVDDEDDDKNDSDGERNSPSDTSEDEDKQSDGAGDKQAEKPQVRKRRPRKAD